MHLLKLDEDGEVTVSRNESDIIGWTADEILRNFLGRPKSNRHDDGWSRYSPPGTQAPRNTIRHAKPES